MVYQAHLTWLARAYRSYPLGAVHDFTFTDSMQLSQGILLDV